MSHLLTKYQSICKVVLSYIVIPGVFSQNHPLLSLVFLFLETEFKICELMLRLRETPVHTSDDATTDEGYRPEVPTLFHRCSSHHILCTHFLILSRDCLIRQMRSLHMHTLFVRSSSHSNTSKKHTLAHP
jgi:hypothetical protein